MAAENGGDRGERGVRVEMPVADVVEAIGARMTPRLTIGPAMTRAGLEFIGNHADRLGVVVPVELRAEVDRAMNGLRGEPGSRPDGGESDHDNHHALAASMEP